MIRSAPAVSMPPTLNDALSFKQQTWRWRLDEEGERRALSIARQHDLPDAVARILAGRGVTEEDADHYLNPTLKTLLPDPSQLKDMDKGVGRITQAITKGEKIAVFGDYDVDGATSSALIALYLRQLGIDTTIYIPDRMKEGYGPNPQAMETLAASGHSVIITVDCGIVAFEAMEAAAEAGADVVIVDHHLGEARLPAAHAVINPNRFDESNALGHLAAVGVSFLLLVAINRRLRKEGWFEETGRTEPSLLEWLDIVALGTICDVVPLKDVNRAFVTQGLRIMTQRRNTGLRTLADTARIDQRLTPYHLGFILGPRINAGGRVGKCSLGAELLSCHDPLHAEKLAGELENLNAERQAIEAMLVDEALAQVEALDSLPPVLFVTGRGWHPGVIGIVSSRLTERYHRPCAVLTIIDGKAKASARSVTGVDLGAAITAARQDGLLLSGGGHAMAAGFTIAEEKIDDLHHFLCERLENFVSRATETRTLKLDGSLHPAGLTPEFALRLEEAGPFGAGYPAPKWMIPAMRLIRHDVVGKGHLRCFFQPQSFSGSSPALKTMAFRAAGTPFGDQLSALSPQEVVHLAGQVKYQCWNGRERAELTLEDVMPASL